MEGYLFQHDTQNILITTKDGDADNCAGEASFQQHYTQVSTVLTPPDPFSVAINVGQPMKARWHFTWEDPHR